MVRNESVAIQHRDLSLLIENQKAKAAILADLAVLANFIDLTTDTGARERLSGLYDRTREHSRILEEMMNAAKKQRRKIRTVVRRLQTLRASYAADTGLRQQALSEHG